MRPTNAPSLSCTLFTRIMNERCQQEQREHRAADDEQRLREAVLPMQRGFIGRHRAGSGQRRRRASPSSAGCVSRARAGTPAAGSTVDRRARREAACVDRLPRHVGDQRRHVRQRRGARPTRQNAPRNSTLVTFAAERIGAPLAPRHRRGPRCPRAAGRASPRVPAAMSVRATASVELRRRGTLRRRRRPPAAR